MEFAKIEKAGVLTTVQDLGRHSYQVFGVSACGGMDTLALRLANILVGNNEGDAVLEATIIGPHITFLREGVIAITGGSFSVYLNGKPVPMWKSLLVTEGDELTFDSCKYGCRAYIAFAGGIDVPMVMGSRSTFIRGNYGGFEGRALKKGDLIQIGHSRFDYRRVSGRKFKSGDVPDYKTARPVRIVLGPHNNKFTNEAIQTLVSNHYNVSNNSDRMGYRLEGKPLQHVNKADIISEFITPGVIQVPANGQPIVHMSDAGTSGGYTVVGVIISVDLPYMAQKKPGDQIEFEVIGVEEAQKLLSKQEQLLSELQLANLAMPSR
ncbi:biotin-dependent carboxyltransferase [Peribacillus saganii]|uniref:Biotin-dependent carboxyltransferase n=2 Tax=Peribacillus saganii TaxID=2303992 RepID=A0A372LR45_9BACI|nr:biotin-dependent carboxyltransferase [Peribacillus saganii]